MARAFRRKRVGGRARYVGQLSPEERDLIVGLMSQTRRLLAPPPAPEPTGDEFEDLVARLGPVPPAEGATVGSGEPGPSGEGDDAGEAGRDPALERLLPLPHHEDPAVAAEFRRLTEHSLRDRKASTLERAITALGGGTEEGLALDHEQATAVLVALTDVRLVLGERLGLRTDEDADLLGRRLAEHLTAQEPGTAEVSPLLYLAGYYDFLTWLQESLAHALAPRR